MSIISLSLSNTDNHDVLRVCDCPFCNIREFQQLQTQLSGHISTTALRPLSMLQPTTPFAFSCLTFWPFHSVLHTRQILPHPSFAQTLSLVRRQVPVPEGIRSISILPSALATWSKVIQQRTRQKRSILIIRLASWHGCLSHQEHKMDFTRQLMTSVFLS